jgi:hypothetical protein
MQKDVVGLMSARLYRVDPNLAKDANILVDTVMHEGVKGMLEGVGRIMDVNNLIHRFRFHAAKDDEKRDAHTSVRQHCLETALFINEKCPDGREKELAIERLEEVMFWANASLARHGSQ